MAFARFASLTTAAILVAVTTMSTAAADFPYTPDARIVGSVCTNNDVDFIEYRYTAQIAYCERNVTSAQKKRIYEDYGIPVRCRKFYTIDHFIPLSLGGTNRLNNLWPEAKSIKKTRQNLELDLFHLLQSGQISQADAIAAIRDAKMNPPIKDPSAIQFCL